MLSGAVGPAGRTRDRPPSNARPRADLSLVPRQLAPVREKSGDCLLGLKRDRIPDVLLLIPTLQEEPCNTGYLQLFRRFS